MRAPAVSATDPHAATARPSRVHLAGLIEGDSASAENLDRMQLLLEQQRLLLLLPMLERALTAMRQERPGDGVKAALEALQLDERSGWAWYILAVCREQEGALADALKCYERALQLMPDSVELPNDLGRLALRLEMYEIAEKLFGHYLARRPDCADGANNLASALRGQERYADAVEVLRTYLAAYPERAALWNTLGTVLFSQGRVSEALPFLDEALRLDPRFSRARYNRSALRLAAGRLDEALIDSAQAIAETPPGPDLAMMKLAHSQLLLADGQVGAGWDAYEARLDPAFRDVVNFMINGPRWTPEEPLRGRSLLVMAEQGLGDEVLFANLIPDLIAELGPQGRLMLAVEPRLVALFARSFPQATVIKRNAYRVDARIYCTAPEFEAKGFDLWTPMASLLRRFRRTVDAFPDTPAFLAPDPARVAHWRAVLDAAGPGPRVGLLWKSMKLDADRSRYFSPFEQWRAVLQVPGVSFVNLQYGDCQPEIATARDRLGVTIHQPAGVDLKDELDEVAALSCVMDLVVGPANATSNIAAACGVPSWLVTTPDAWPRLGTDRYPWYPSMRVFEAPKGLWAPVMAEVAAALRAEFPTGG